MSDIQDMTSSVHIARWSDCSVAWLESHLASTGLLKSLRQAARVVIKVNLSAGHSCTPESGVVTNRAVLRRLLETLLHVNPSVQIYVAESDSIGRSLATEKFRFQGYASLFADLSAVHLVDLSHSPVQVYPCAGRFFKDGVVLASTFAEADFFISLAKMKTHSVAVMTGCLKNQFGCLPDMHKDRYHPYLPAVIADVNSAVRPDLCILEACPAMEGNGPVLGDPRDLGIILLGVDPLAIDATAARIMGMQPERILLFVEAEQAAVGTWRPEQIRVTGLTCAEIGGRFKFISREQRLYVIGESCKGRTISGRPQAPLDAKIVRSLSGLSIRFGLAIQWAADRLNGLGHRLHLVQGTGWAIGRIVSKAKKGLTRGASHGAA